MNILDDVLSAVDAEVGRAIFSGAILEALVGRGKSVVLATHQLQYLPYADKIIVLSDHGQQLFCGSYDEMRRVTSAAAEIEVSPAIGVAGGTGAIDPDAHGYLHRIVSAVSTSASSTVSKSELREAFQRSAASQRETLKRLAERAVAGSSSADDGNAASDSSSKAASPSTTQMYGVQEEEKESGGIRWSFVKNYFLSGGLFRGIIVFIVAILSQGIAMIADYWPQCAYR